jgi:hypothetical protein
MQGLMFKKRLKDVVYILQELKCRIDKMPNFNLTVNTYQQSGLTYITNHLNN